MSCQGQQAGSELTTPLALGESLDPPRYGDSVTEPASRAFLAAYKGYVERVELANAAGVVRHRKMSLQQLIPSFVQRSFSRFYHRTVCHDMDEEELLDALKRHAGYNTTAAECDRAHAAAKLRRVVSMKPGKGSVKNRAMEVCSSLEKYFAENPKVLAMYRAKDGTWLPGPAEFVSKAIVDGLSPRKFRAHVRGILMFESGWKQNPDMVFRKIFDAGEEWKIVEAYGQPEDGARERHTRHLELHSKQRSSHTTSLRTCYKCGEAGHVMEDCPNPHAGSVAQSSVRNSSGLRSGRQGRRRSCSGGNQAVTDRGASSGGGGATVSSVWRASGRMTFVGGGGNAVGTIGVDSSQPLGRAGPASGASRAGAAVATAPYSEKWCGWRVGSVSPTLGGREEPWHKVTCSIAQGHSAGVVPVDRRAECLIADLSLPGAAGSFVTRVILGSGSALTSIGAGLLAQVSAHFGGAELRLPFENGPLTAHTATGDGAIITHKTVPITMSLWTPSGAATLPPITFAVMPGSDDVVLFGMATMKALGIDVYSLALEKLRPRAVPVNTAWERPGVVAARGATASNPSFQVEVAEEAAPEAAVERLVGTEVRGPRARPLEDSTPQREQSGLSADDACRLRHTLARRVDPSRRALRGDPPARVEHMQVQQNRIAQAVESKPRRYKAVAVGWLASCIAALVAFGLLVRNIQAV